MAGTCSSVRDPSLRPLRSRRRRSSSNTTRSATRSQTCRRHRPRPACLTGAAWSCCRPDKCCTRRAPPAWICTPRAVRPTPCGCQRSLRVRRPCGAVARTRCMAGRSTASRNAPTTATMRRTIRSCDCARRAVRCTTAVPRRSPPWACRRAPSCTTVASSCRRRCPPATTVSKSLRTASPRRVIASASRTSGSRSSSTRSRRSSRSSIR